MEKHLAYLRTQPCLACGAPPPSEAAHTYDGSSGMGKKARDENAIPLCSACHRTGNLSYHAIGERRFLEIWGIDLERERRRLRCR